MLQNILDEAQKKFDAALDHFRSKLSAIRTSRANPALIKDIKVKAYQTEMTLKELAAIEVPRPNLLLVSPWDQGIIEAIEKALRTSGLSLNPITEGGAIKIPLPLLSQEQREEYTKLVGEKTEEARIAMRNVRREKIKEVEGLEESKQISKDEREWFKKQLQKLVDEYNEKIEVLRKAKEKELMGV